MKELPARLARDANRTLVRYGGLKGLAEEPAWLISSVVKSFFPGDQAKLILEYVKRLKQGGKHRAE